MNNGRKQVLRSALKRQNNLLESLSVGRQLKRAVEILSDKSL